MSGFAEDSPLEKRASNRRGFFREGLASLLQPLTHIIERRMQAVADAVRSVERPVLLRPPGALPETDFVRTCSSSAACVAACPVQAIYLVAEEGGAHSRTARPVIHAASQPCVLCEPLACMRACPSGALRPTPLLQIDMGRAVVDHGLCLRSSGQHCTTCVSRCPVGEKAIHLEGQSPKEPSPVVVEPDGCVGCGVCEFYCPAQPKAIVVEPRD